MNKALLSRLRRIEGQVRGLQRLLEKDTYCIDIITQTSAVRSALLSFEDKLLESHLSTCAVEQIKTGKEDLAITEILKIYKLKR